MSNMASYVITQATGGQSRWVITHLLAAGAKVHAVVRDLKKELPAVLKLDGVTLFQGDSTNVDDIYKAAQGCKGVFLNTYPYPGLETQQAKAIVEAARKAGIETIVASSTSGTDDKSFWTSNAAKAIMVDGYYASKNELEEAVRGGGFQFWTILRPAVIHHDFFSSHLAENYPRLSTSGEIDSLLTPGNKMTFTDASDVGKYAAAALLDPARFSGQAIDLSHELFDFDEVSNIINRISGKHVKAVQRTPEELQAAGTFVFGQVFQLLANARDFTPNSKAAPAVQAKFGISFTPLEDSLMRDKALLLETLQNVE